MNHNELLAPADFDELADWLVSVSSAFSPAELHGAIIGGLSGSMRLSAREWSLFGLAIMGAGEQLSPDDSNNTQATVGGLAQSQLALLASSDLTFQPFLPDDDSSIEQRTEAVSFWCRGFLGGFAEAQVKRQRSGEVTGNEALPESVVEALRDMAAIAQATVEADQDEYDDEFDDNPLNPGDLRSDDSGLADDTLENAGFENDYMEIVEYLRLAALTVFTEYGWVEAYQANEKIADAGSSTGAPSDKTLH
jgi:hypothetical protein